MLRAVMILCLVASTMAALGLAPGHLLQKYTHMKMLSGCFGEEVLQDYLDRIRDANAKCHHHHYLHESHEDSDSHSNEDVSEDHHHASEEDDDVHGESESDEHDEGSEDSGEVREIKYVPLPYYLPYRHHLNEKPLHTISDQYTLSLRHKRDAHDEEESDALHHIVREIEDLHCVLRELNIVDDKSEPNVSSLKEMLDEMAIPAKLRNDFKEALDGCLDFAMCHSSDDARQPLAQKLGRTMAFMRCVHKMKTVVCMKQDFAKYLLLEKRDINEDAIFELMMTFGEGEDLLDFF
ncbi:uncharacterized protein LOC143018145 [Oratosquilla oratoria]|uniref:uncharacterized protein LOC143018145 n=1 Tax=Oratosquilla oratoria TaxID=337810 RepID=UPI003F75BDC0